MSWISKMFTKKPDYLDDGFRYGSGDLFKRGKGQTATDPTSVFAEELNKETTMPAQKPVSDTVAKRVKAPKTKQPGLLKPFLDKRTLAIWDELPASAKRMEYTKCGAIGLAGVLASGLVLALLEDKYGFISNIFKKVKKDDNIETEPVIVPAADSTANKTDTTATIDSKKIEEALRNFKKTETPYVSTPGENTFVPFDVRLKELADKNNNGEWTISYDNLPEDLNPGSYEYIRPDGSRSGIFNAHAAEIPVKSDAHIVKKGDTLWNIANNELKKLLGEKAKLMSEGELETLRRKCMQAICQDKRNPEYLNWEPGKCCQRLDIGDSIYLDAVKQTLEDAKLDLAA